MPAPDRSAIIHAARKLYTDGPALLKRMQHLRPYICPFEELLPLVPVEATVLDIGCGSGLFLGLLQYFGFRIQGLGFDASPPAIECAKLMAHRHGNRSLRFDYLPRNAPWPEGRFGVVSMIDVLHHIPVARQENAFRAAAGRVAPGGLFLYKDMSSFPLFPAAMNRLHDLVVAREWINYVPVHAAERWARGEGLQPQTSRSFRTLWYQHDLRVFRRPMS